ncbi:PAS domain S-box protein [bacterium]|nr:PAS domain S-box protein [bacterium]
MTEPKINKGEIDILIVEDSPTQALRLQHVLQKDGYRVTWSQNGRQALALARQTPPAIVISDVVMPEMDGFELCRQIKSDPQLKSTPVILVSALNEPDDIVQGLISGADNFLTKPYEDDLLLSRVEYTLINRDLRWQPVSERGLEVFFLGKKHLINSDRSQILDLLFSTYESVMLRGKELEKKNVELNKAHQDLRALNQSLEKQVLERTERIRNLNRIILAVRNVNKLIAKEKDRGRLLQGVCDSLVSTGAFKCARVFVLCEKGGLEWHADSETMGRMRYSAKKMHLPSIPAIFERALQSPEVVLLDKDDYEDSDLFDCRSCPIEKMVLVRVENNAKVFGLLVVTLPEGTPLDEEGQQVLLEVALDIGLGLGNADLELEKLLSQITLVTSEQKYRSLFENMYSGFSYHEMILEDGKAVDYRFLEVNSSFEKQTGLKRSDLIGKTASAILARHPGGIPDLTDISTRVMKKKKAGVEDFYFEPRDKWFSLVVYSPDPSHFAAIYNDITDRMRMEQELRQSEAAYHELYENAPVGYQELDSKGSIVRVNRTESELLGYSPEQLLGRPVFDLIDPEEREISRKNFSLKIAGKKEVAPFNRRYLCRDGRVIDCMLDEKLVYDQSGAICGIRTTVKDISELKRAEEALEHRLEIEKFVASIATVFNNLKDGQEDSGLDYTLEALGEFADFEHVYLSLLSRDSLNMARIYSWHTSSVQPQATEVMTFPAEHFPWCLERLHRFEKIAVSDVDSLPEQAATDREWLKSYSLTSLVILPLVSEFTLFGFLGFDTSRGAKPLGEDFLSPLVLVGEIVVNVLERKRMGEARRLLQAAFEQAAETVIIADTQRNIEYVNPALEQVSGYSRQEILGRSIHLFKSDRQDEDQYKELWDTVDAGDFWQGRLISRRKDGTDYHEDVTFSPVKDASGRVVHYVAVKRDISQELELENQLVQAQKMESIGLLAGGVAHDFNNILAIVLGYANLLVRSPNIPEKDRKKLEEIEQAAQRGAVLTRQLLTFSRKGKPRFAVVNFNDILNESLGFLQRTIGPDCSIDLDLAGDLGQIRADATQMQQVLMNLAINSRDAMPGGGKISFKTANIDIDKRYLSNHLDIEPGNYIQVSVTDTGAGMPPEIQARIFEPFFTTKETGKGTGLGLSVVYGIVKSHRGLINVYSEPGCGTTFRIYLPRTNDQVEDKSASEVVVKGGTENVLLVDDEQPILQMAASILAEFGYKCCQAASGEEALGIFAEAGSRIDLVISDIGMPNMNGTELMQRLRAVNPKVKIIFSSGYAPQSTREMIEMGVNGFVAKPYQAKALAQAVRKVLDGEHV